LAIVGQAEILLVKLRYCKTLAELVLFFKFK